MSKLTQDELDRIWKYTEMFDPDLYSHAGLVGESYNMANIIQSLLRHIESIEEGA